MPQPRLRPTLPLKTLFAEWKAGTNPRPQSALEYEAPIDDFIDFAGDVAVAAVEADMLYDYRDAGAKLPASMPRADRRLPFRARVEKHAQPLPKCAADAQEADRRDAGDAHLRLPATLDR